MKDRDKLTEETFKIPLDILLDILVIIVKEGLKHEIIEVFPNRALVLMTVFYNKESAKAQKAVRNMENLILDYEYLRYSENEELNWREI